MQPLRSRGGRFWQDAIYPTAPPPKAVSMAGIIGGAASCAVEAIAPAIPGQTSQNVPHLVGLPSALVFVLVGADTPSHSLSLSAVTLTVCSPRRPLSPPCQPYQPCSGCNVVICPVMQRLVSTTCQV
jgi:hypothetical protein